MGLRLPPRASDYDNLVSVLLVTATDAETTEVLNNLRPLPSESAVITLSMDSRTFHLGMFGIYGVAVVQSEMGTAAPNASLITTLRSIEVWSPRAVIMVGIAFGTNSETQHIGDVIVSSQIIPYENARIGRQSIDRGERPQQVLYLSIASDKYVTGSFW